MGMREQIVNFNKQFAFEPEIKNAANLRKYKKFIVAGMGGSHLAGDLIKGWMPELDIVINSDYGLPTINESRKSETLLIASSYSGNTEETLDAFKKAQEENISIAVVAAGGELLRLADETGSPYVQLPDTGIQPRMATGFSFKALLKLMGQEDALKEVTALAGTLKPSEYEDEGKALAERLRGHIPVIYSSSRNRATAYNWKIKFNETGKIPAFCNAFPELNHNEMTGFDIQEATSDLSKNFYFIILRDRNDHPKILKRMEVMAGLLKKRGLPPEFVELKGKNIFEKMFASLVLADWVALYTAEGYGVESEKVPMVEEFKKLI
ncbi:MAG: bifunctional phosphoglucose/phosphomannose isomerase [bacterium]|nr:bifunctional phosphoglucose/phosphomannose isomerase [bacterium]